MLRHMLLAALILIPQAAFCRSSPSSDQRIDAGMQALLHGNTVAVKESLDAKIEDKDLRRELSDILSSFKPGESALARKAADVKEKNKTFSLSDAFAALDAEAAASALRGFRLRLHAALASAAKKYGLDKCPFAAAKK